MYFKLHLFLFISVANTANSELQFKMNLSNRALSEENDSSQIDEIPADLHAILRKQDNEKIKRQLDNFTMDRKKTHIVLLGHGPDDIVLKNNTQHKGHVYQQYNKIENPQTAFFYKDPKLSIILRAQTELMTKLLRIIKGNAKSTEPPGFSFDDMVEMLDQKHKMASTEISEMQSYEKSKGTTAKTTTPQLSTIMTLIDESEVRRALKNDPLVQRILKLARKRREMYFKYATPK